MRRFKGTCHCGCGERTKLAPRGDARKGWVKGEPMRFIAGHQRRSSPVEFLCDPGTGCWVWQRSVNGDGYGKIRIGGVLYLAHRVYYERLVGPIPEGLELDHDCRNPACVNPAHLEPVTHAENLRRRVMT